jgi:hypothetical protein
MANRQDDTPQGDQGIPEIERSPRTMDDPEKIRSGSDEEIRGVGDEDEDMDEIEELDEEEEEDGV